MKYRARGGVGSGTMSPRAPSGPRRRRRIRVPAAGRRKAAAPGSRGRKSAAAAVETPGWFGSVLAKARDRAERRAAALRALHPDETPRALGERLVRSAANRAGLLGAATGTL